MALSKGLLSFYLYQAADTWYYCKIYLEYPSLSFFFDTMLHLGTLVAVVIVMWKDIIALFKKPYLSMMYLVIATIPAVIFAVLFENFFEGAFGGMYLGYSFILTAVILSLSEVIASRTHKRRSLKSGGALVMGLMQVVGMLPGISRSGSTIAGGLAFGIDRQKAARFSFLMSIPAIVGSVIFQGVDILKDTSLNIEWAPIIIGTTCAAIAGIFAVKFMLALIRKKRLYGFAIYVAIIGVFVLLDQYLLGLISWA